MNNQPYTYLIGWSQLNKYYYGVQYGKKANPANLWKTYFTSSKQVKKFREEHGEPDVIQVRQCFDDPLKAKQWEDTVLVRFASLNRDNWINKRFGAFANSIMTDEIRNNMRKPKRNTDKMGRYQRTVESKAKRIASIDLVEMGKTIAKTHEGKVRIFDLDEKKIYFLFHRDEMPESCVLWEDLPVEIKQEYQYNLGDTGKSGRGKFWITNVDTHENKKIPIDTQIPINYIKGKYEKRRSK